MGSDVASAHVEMVRPWSGTAASDLAVYTSQHVYLTGDGGAHWRLVRTLSAGTIVDVALVHLEAQPVAMVVGWNDGVPDKMFIAASRDGGATFTSDPPTPTYAGSMLFDGQHRSWQTACRRGGRDHRASVAPRRDGKYLLTGREDMPLRAAATPGGNRCDA